MKVIELPAKTAQGMIRLYQLILSPFIGNQCRFHPSCSNYALEAVQRHGVIRGGWLTARRLGRCHPFHAGGFDPVPPLNAYLPAEDDQPVSAGPAREHGCCHHTCASLKREI